MATSTNRNAEQWYLRATAWSQEADDLSLQGYILLRRATGIVTLRLDPMSDRSLVSARRQSAAAASLGILDGPAERGVTGAAGVLDPPPDPASVVGLSLEGQYGNELSVTRLVCGTQNPTVVLRCTC